MDVWSETVLAKPMAGKRRRADDQQPRGRNVDRRVRRRPVGHGDVLAEVLVQLRHRGRAEDDLTRSVDTVAAQDGRRDGRVDVLHEERHALAVDLHVVERGAAVGGDVPVALQQREGTCGTLPLARSDRVEDVRPVPSVQGRAGDQGLQAAPERQRRHHERDGEHRPEQRRAHGDGAAALDPVRAPCAPRRRRGPRGRPVTATATTRAPVVDRIRGRSAVRCGAVAYARRTAIALRSTKRARTPKPRTVQSNEIPLDGYTGRTGPSGASGDSADGDHRRQQRSERGSTATMPMRPSSTVSAGPAPRARSIWRSPASSGTAAPSTGRRSGAPPGGRWRRRPQVRWRSASASDPPWRRPVPAHGRWR